RWAPKTEAFGMPGAGTRQVVAITSALALLGAALGLLFCTEPVAVRFWFALAVMVGIVSFFRVSIAATALCKRCGLLTGRARVSRLARETGHDEYGSAFLRSLLLFER